MERILIPLSPDADLPGLEKKLNVDSFTVTPGQNQVILSGTICFFKGDRELKDVKSAQVQIKTPDVNVYDPTNPEDVSVAAIKSILPAITKFYNDRVKKDAEAEKAKSAETTEEVTK